MADGRGPNERHKSPGQSGEIVAECRLDKTIRSRGQPPGRTGAPRQTNTSAGEEKGMLG